MQSYSPSHRLLELMEEYRQMTNDSIRIGLANNKVSTMRRLSKLSYKELKKFVNVPSHYMLCAISKASGIISSMNKSVKRGHKTKDQYVQKQLLVSCYGFKIVNGNLRIP